MNSDSLKIIKQILFNRDAVLSMILPALLYGLVYHYFGLVEAVIVSGLYAGCSSFFLKSAKFIVFVFSVFGLIEICLIGLLPEKWLVDTIFIKSVIGALQTAIVFLVFSLLGKPVPKLFAEVASPELKEWDFSTTKAYLNIWQKVSYTWVAVYVAKAMLFIAFYPMTTDSLVTFNLVLGWPLYLGLIAFSVPYVQAQFAKYASI